ncbi:MAG: hypothetical protein ACHQ1H_09600 [Nitrososphaerales archaeon]
MDPQTSIIIILIISILGIIAVSVYGLYLQDKLVTRLETLEKSVNTPAKVAEINKAGSGNGKISNENESISTMDDKVQNLLDDMTSNRSRLQAIEKELSASNARIGILVKSQSDQQTNDSSVSNEIQLLQREVVELRKRVDFVQKENAEIITRITLSEEL